MDKGESRERWSDLHTDTWSHLLFYSPTAIVNFIASCILKTKRKISTGQPPPHFPLNFAKGGLVLYVCGTQNLQNLSVVIEARIWHNRVMLLFSFFLVVQAAFSDFLQRSSRDLSKHVKVVVSTEYVDSLYLNVNMKHPSTNLKSQFIYLNSSLSCREH